MKDLDKYWRRVYTKSHQDPFQTRQTGQNKKEDAAPDRYTWFIVMLEDSKSVYCKSYKYVATISNKEDLIHQELGTA